jgi:hypothetical protein
MSIYFQKVKRKKLRKKIIFVVAFLKVITGFGSVNQRCGSPNVYINVICKGHPIELRLW